MKPKKPLAVAFDMDGLMLESENLWDELDAIALAEYGVEYDPALKTIFMGMERLESAKRFCKAYGLNERPEVIADKRSKLARRLYSERVALMSGVEALVEALQNSGRKLAVATSAEREILEIVRSKFEVFKKFQAIVCADDVERGKPAPDLYLAAAKALGVSPEDCLALEDSPNGAEAACSAGMKVIGVPHPETGFAAMKGADVCVNSLELVTLVMIEELFEQK